MYSKSRRIRRKPTYLEDYVTEEAELEEELNLISVAQIEDPITFEDAMKNKKWKQAMDCETESIEKNGTRKLTELPSNAKKIGVKWVFKTKFNEKGEIEKHKAKLVARGFSQKHGIDYPCCSMGHN